MSSTRRKVRFMRCAACAPPADEPGLAVTNLYRSALLAVLMGLAASVHAELDIDAAVRLALQSDPVIAAGAARARALDDTAIADGQLPDPKLTTGIASLPTDDFDIDKEPMTQLRIGVSQAFPRGDSLHLKQLQTGSMAAAEAAATQAASRKLVRDVRNQFLELYYQLRAEQVINETRALFAQLVEITTAQYGTGRANQQDVLRASLELSRLDDRTTRVLSEADKARAALAKWIGEAAQQPLDARFPELPALPPRKELAAALPQHPLFLAETEKLEASKRAIQLAREQYKPGWSAALDYNRRFGDDPSGDPRSDMLSAMVSIDLPVFPGNRQDKRLSASILQAESAQLTRDDRLRELQQMLDTDYASWDRLNERAARYEAQLLHEAAANARASLNAYQSGVGEFSTLMRARITDLDVRLEDLRIRIDRARTHASLLYLAGEDR